MIETNVAVTWAAYLPKGSPKGVSGSSAARPESVMKTGSQSVPGFFASLTTPNMKGQVGVTELPQAHCTLHALDFIV